VGIHVESAFKRLFQPGVIALGECGEGEGRRSGCRHFLEIPLEIVSSEVSSAGLARRQLNLPPDDN
jgi:hypothetical protein